MVAGATAFRKYVEETGELPESVVLGHICYFTITEEGTPVTHAQIDKLFAELGLNPKFIPHVNEASDAFKKATKDVEKPESGRNYLLAGGKKMKLLVRDVASDRTKIVRHIVREIVDSENVRLAYDTVGEAIFYHAEVDSKTGKRKPTGHRLRVTMHYDLIGEDERETMEGVRKRISAKYEHDCQFLDGMKLRDMVRDYIKYLNGVQLKPSVYFVHQSRHEELGNLSTLIDRLANGSGMHMLPMVDVPAQRAEVIAKFTAEAESNVQSLLRDIGDAMTRQTKVTADTYRRLKEKYDDIQSKALEYSRTLGLAQESTAVWLDLAIDRLLEVQTAAIDNEAEALAKKQGVAA